MFKKIREFYYDLKITKVLFNSGFYTPDKFKDYVPRFYIWYLWKVAEYRHRKYDRRMKKYLKLEKKYLKLKDRLMISYLSSWI